MDIRTLRLIQSALLALLLLAASALLAACTPPAAPPPVPSEDPASRAATVAVIQTQAVAAFFQTLTQQALLVPAATATPFPTRTPADTATASPTVPPLVLPTTAVPTVPINTPGNNIVYTPPPAAYQCKVEYQSPSMGQKISIGQDFDLNVIFKNTGTSTWNDIEFDFSYVSGAKFQEWEDTFELGQNIGPGGGVSFTVDMIAKTGTGVQQATWALKKGGSPICYIYIDIFVE